MNRLKTNNNPTQESQALLDAIQKKVGATPNIYKAMSHSPAALNALLAFGEKLGSGLLSPALREKIALTVAGINECDYCASAHTFIGGKAGLTQDEMSANLQSETADEKDQVVLDFVKAVVERKAVGVDPSPLYQAGYSEGEVVEVIANISQNIFTNYFNHIANPDVDFPFVSSTRETARAF